MVNSGPNAQNVTFSQCKADHKDFTLDKSLCFAEPIYRGGGLFFEVGGFNSGHDFEIYDYWYNLTYPNNSTWNATTPGKPDRYQD